MVFGAIFDKIKKGLAKTRDLFSGVASLFRLRGRADKEFLAHHRAAMMGIKTLQPMAAAILLSRSSLSHSAAAAAELQR